MSDIVIYTNPEILDHKKCPEFTECWWEMSRKPTRLKVGERIHFATKDVVRGSFQVTDIKRTYNRFEIYWEPSSWRNNQIGEVSPRFRGFRYRWWKRKQQKEKQD